MTVRIRFDDMDGEGGEMIATAVVRAEFAHVVYGVLRTDEDDYVAYIGSDLKWYYNGHRYTDMTITEVST